MYKRITNKMLNVGVVRKRTTFFYCAIVRFNPWNFGYFLFFIHKLNT